jgi:hypothetical protein
MIGSVIGSVIGLALWVVLGFWASPPQVWGQSLPDPLADAALPYAIYQDDVSWLQRTPIETAAALDEALDRAMRHEPQDLVRGWIAYEALVAAQSPAFVHGVEARVRAAGRQAVLRRLAIDPTYARKRPEGANEAIQLVLQSSAADSARIAAAADRFEHLQDGLRAMAWASADEGDQTARLDRLGRLPAAVAPADLAQHLRIAPLSAQPLRDPNALGGRSFWDALANAPAPQPITAPSPLGIQPARAALIDRILTLAALRIVGAADDRLLAASPDLHAANCLVMRRLELRQCLSVTQYGYEQAYCVAQHGLREPGTCLGSLAR